MHVAEEEAEFFSFILPVLFDAKPRTFISRNDVPWTIAANVTDDLMAFPKTKLAPTTIGSAMVEHVDERKNCRSPTLRSSAP